MVVLNFHQLWQQIKLIEHVFAHWGFKLLVTLKKKVSSNNNYFGLICSLRNLLTLFIFSKLGESSAPSFPRAIVPDPCATWLVKWNVYRIFLDIYQ